MSPTEMEMLCSWLTRVEEKLDATIKEKADKTSVDELRVWFVRATIGFIVTLVGIVGYFAKGHIPS